jgi:TonB family protein
MSVAEQTVSTSKSPRRIPSTVRLGPRVVNHLCTQESEKAGADDDQGLVGLLFGTAEQDILSVEAFKTCGAADPAGNTSFEPQALDIAFERSLATAKADPNLTSLHLVGWYCVRRPDDLAPLSESDIEFHNRRFRRATDVLLVLKQKQHGAASIELLELYSRSSPKAAISRRDYRCGSLVLASAEVVNSPSDVAMRQTFDDDYYLRVFQVLESLDRAEKREGWRRIALRLKAITPPSLRPRWMKTAQETSRLPDDVTSRTRLLPGASATPQENSPLPRARSAQPKLRWRSSAALLLLVIGLALTWVYARSFLSGLAGKALFHRAPAPLNLRVDPQGGGSLLVRWDAHSAPVQSAKTGNMQIDDGSEHHDLHLDRNQVANGSILYSPVSRDLTFRLEVVGGNAAVVSESMRVVNGVKSALAPHSIPNARPTKIADAARVSEDKTGFRQSDATSHRKEKPRAVTQKGPHAITQQPMRPPTRKAPEGEPKSPSSGKPEVHKTIQDLAPTQSQVSSPEPAATNNKIASPAYVPPRPLKQVMPSPANFPPSALSGAVDIEIEVTIDDAGRVTEARVVKNWSDNSGLLTRAALTAAKEWIFEPAQRYGKSVPSDHVIKFRFRPPTGQQ